MKYLLFAALLLTGCSKFDQGLQAFDQGHCQQALQIWQKDLIAQDAKTLYYTGLIYHQGCADTKADPKLAIQYFSQAADQNYALAYLALGRIHMDHDKKLAQEYLIKSAELGEPYAAFELVKLSDTPVQAQKWYMIAVLMGGVELPYTDHESQLSQDLKALKKQREELLGKGDAKAAFAQAQGWVLAHKDHRLTDLESR